MFCAGADLKERKQMTPEQVVSFKRDMVDTFIRFENMPCPTISVMDGPALGGGCELSLCSDMRIATESSIIGLPETGLAIIPGAGGTQRLPRLVGVALAKELIFTGRRLNAAEAYDIGLVNYVRPDHATALEKAVELATIISEKGPVAIRAAKQAISHGINMDLTSALQFEEACYAKTLHTEDRLEGLRAFAEKRKPVYTGK